MSEVQAVADPVQAAIDSLVSAERWPDATFIRLPIVYPGGSLVTVKVSQISSGIYRVSDSGFGFRELEGVGAQRSFSRTVFAIAEESGVNRDSRSLFIDVPGDELSRAISDVGVASWQVVERVYATRPDEDEEEIIDHLTERLNSIFGKSSVKTDATLIGASTGKWPVTALVKTGARIIAFQAVSAHANSVYRANSAFDDLSSLDNPPGLVAVVHKAAALGTRLTLLARNARVIEEDQPDATFLRAAA